MTENNTVEASNKKTRSASRHNKMPDAALFHLITSLSLEELGKIDFKKDKGVLFLKSAAGHRESYTETVLERLKIAASGDAKTKIQFVLDRIDAVNKKGSSPEELFGRTVPVSINSRNHSALVPAVGTLFGILGEGMVFVTYEQGKVTITASPPAPSVNAESASGRKAAR